MGTPHKLTALKLAAAATLAILAVGTAPDAKALGSATFTFTDGADVVSNLLKFNMSDPTAIYQQLATCSSGPGCTSGLTALGQPFEETGYFDIVSGNIATLLGLPANTQLVLAFTGLTGTLSSNGSAIIFNTSAAGSVGLFNETNTLTPSTNPFGDGSTELESFHVIAPSSGIGGFDAFDSLTTSSNVGITLMPDGGNINTFTDISGNPFANGYVAAISVQPVLSNNSAGAPISCPAFTGLTGMCSLLTPDGDTGQFFIDPIPTPEPGSIALLSGGLMSLAWFALRRRASQA